MNHGEVRGHAGVFQFAEPLLVVVVQLVAGPVDGVSGVGVESFKMIVGGTVFVVVALDAGNIHLADDLQAFIGVGVIADDIAQTDDMGGILGADIFQHNLKSFQISVNVCDDGVFHC